MSLRIVVFDRAISSTWDSSYTMSWRALCRALHALGHEVVFYEREAPLHAAFRDLDAPPYCELVRHDDFETVRARAAADLDSADAAIVSSRCADAPMAIELMLASRVPTKAMYDLDPAMTLARLKTDEPAAHVGATVTATSISC